MPKLVCPCGFVHDLSPIPDGGWVTVRDADYEALIESWTGSKVAEGGPSAFVRLTGRLYECPECGGVLWEKPGEQSFRAYRPDS
jgi:hypothetical protein